MFVTFIEIFRIITKKNKMKKADLAFFNQELGTNYKRIKDIDWDSISIHQKLTPEFMEKHWGDLNKDYISKYYISKYQKLTPELMEKHWGDLDKYDIIVYQKLTPELIEKHWGDLDKDNISRYQKLTPELMEKHWGDLNKYDISVYQKLTPELMEKHWGDLDKYKYNISTYQKLTPEFMEKYWDVLDKDNISRYQKLTPEFMEKYDIKLGNDNWLYVSEEIKKESVIKSGLYECYDDYFIAYKGIRSDRYSNYNFQYQYLPGETYESHADCSNDENSFGLSVWTEDGAMDYCSQLVVKCMVYYKDVARMVHNNGKLRCFKIKILN